MSLVVALASLRFDKLCFFLAMAVAEANTSYAKQSQATPSRAKQSKSIHSLSLSLVLAVVAATVVVAVVAAVFAAASFSGPRKTKGQGQGASSRAGKGKKGHKGPARGKKGRALTSGMGAGCCAAWVNTSAPSWMLAMEMSALHSGSPTCSTPGSEFERRWPKC